VTATDWVSVAVVGLSALLFYTALYAWRPRQAVIKWRWQARRLEARGSWPYRAAGGWAVWTIIVLLGIVALVGIWASNDRGTTSEPAIQPVLVRTLPLSLAHAVVVAAGRDGLPAHLALELGESESRIRHIDRIEYRADGRGGRRAVQWDCGPLQIAAPLATGCVLSEWEEIEVGVGMAANWWRIAGGRLEDWPRARQAYRQGHLAKARNSLQFANRN